MKIPKEVRQTLNAMRILYGCSYEDVAKGIQEPVFVVKRYFGKRLTPSEWLKYRSYKRKRGCDN